MKSLRRIWAVAWLTAAEGLRQPAFFILFLASAGLTVLSPKFAVFHLDEGAKMVVDLGLSTTLTFSSLLALLTASATVSDEIEGRTALMMLAKPLRREEFIAGKYLGVITSAVALNLLMGPLILATHRSQMYDSSLDVKFESGVQIALLLFLVIAGGGWAVRLLISRGFGSVGWFWLAFALATGFMFIYLAPGAAVSARAPKWDWRILSGVLFTSMHACLISAFAVALATRLTLVQASIGTVAFFLVGHASGAILAPFHDGSGLSVPGLILRAVLPDLDQFNVTDALATAFMDTPLPIPWDVIAGSIAYAAVYSTALLALAAGLFANRELS